MTSKDPPEARGFSGRESLEIEGKLVLRSATCVYDCLGVALIRGKGGGGVGEEEQMFVLSCC